MQGFVGIIRKESFKENRAAVKAMLGCIASGGDFALDGYGDPVLSFLGGWAAPRGSEGEGVSFWNEKRDLCLVFSGESYGGIADADRAGAGAETTSPETPRYLLHLYEEMGLEFLNKINGWFRGILVDLRQGKVFLFNDRYGLGRIYYHENDGGLYFSTEAKSLLKIFPECRRVDPDGLAEFVSCGCVLQNRTLFSGVSLLPPASLWTFSPAHGIQKQVYFSPEQWERQPALSGADFYDALKEVWARLLPRYFRGKKHIGLSLTGGVDSRLILAWAPCAPGTLPCVTFGGGFRDCMDVKIARTLARISRQPHEIIPINGSFFSEFPTLAEKSVFISDGAMDVTGAIDLYVQTKAQQVAPIRVTGTNGGEVIRRIVAFKPKPFPKGILRPEIEALLPRAAATYNKELQGNRLSFTAFKQAPWFLGSKFTVERSAVTLRMPYFDNDLLALLYRAPSEHLADSNVSMRLIEEANPELSRIATDRDGRRGFWAARSVERAFKDFTFKAEYAYDYGMPHWLARIDRVLAPLHLERLFLGRHKIHHFRLYYRNELASYVRSVLLDARTLGRSYLCANRVTEIVNSHVRGTGNYTLEIHKLLTLELIQRQLIEQN